MDSRFKNTKAYEQNLSLFEYILSGTNGTAGLMEQRDLWNNIYVNVKQNSVVASESC
jgi:hypothetical protein